MDWELRRDVTLEMPHSTEKERYLPGEKHPIRDDIQENLVALLRRRTEAISWDQKEVPSINSHRK